MSEEIDPSDFVQRIRQLGEQRDQQDAERVRKLEEEIIQGRSERLARRAGMVPCSGPSVPGFESLPLTLCFAHRTRALTVARQALDAAIAALCSRHAAKCAGEGR